MLRTVVITAHYAAPADVTFEEALRAAEMKEAMRGLAEYHGLPDGVVHEGDSFTVDVTFLKLFTTRGHTMTVETLDRARRVLQSREHNSSIARWDHRLSVAPTRQGCVWTDRVVLDAGLQTWGVARFCRFVYLRRHKMRRALTLEANILRGEVLAPETAPATASE